MNLTKTTKFQFENLLILIIPVLNMFSFDGVGRVYLGELMLIMLFPVLLMMRMSSYKLPHECKIIIVLGVFWLFSQIITDIIVESDFKDYSRGWAKIGFFIISFISLTYLITSIDKIYFWFIGSIIPYAVRPLIELPTESIFIQWKFGFGLALLMTITAGLTNKLMHNINVSINTKKIAWRYIVFGLFSFFMDGRSLAGVCIVTGGCLLIHRNIGGYILQNSQLVKGFTAFIGLGFFIIWIYSILASGGFLGQVASEKFKYQYAAGNSDPVSILLGGRSELIVSSVAIMDSPIIGHGSWAKDYKYFYMMFDLKRDTTEDSREVQDADTLGGLIPTHSYIFGAWVEAGLLGGIFWVFILGNLLFSQIKLAFRLIHGTATYLIVAIIPLFWNILFSPFGADIRLSTAATLVSIYYISRQRNKLFLGVHQ